MSRISSRSKAITLTVLGPVLAFSLVACGGGSSGGSATAASTPNPSASGGPGGAPGGFDMSKIQACLKAAGISVPTNSDFPRPSGSFSPGGTPPSGARPSGPPSGGGAGGLFNSPEAQAALKACGITMPTGGPGPNATPTS